MTEHGTIIAVERGLRERFERSYADDVQWFLGTGPSGSNGGLPGPVRHHVEVELRTVLLAELDAELRRPLIHANGERDLAAIEAMRSRYRRPDGHASVRSTVRRR